MKYYDLYIDSHNGSFLIRKNIQHCEASLLLIPPQNNCGKLKSKYLLISMYVLLNDLNNKNNIKDVSIWLNPKLN